MADQTIRVESLPDNSRQRVAYDLMRVCAEREGWVGLDSRADIIKLYSDCLKATSTTYQYDATKL